MNGATVDPWLKTIKNPKIPSIKKIGYSHHFFLYFKKTINSFKKLIIKIDFS
tara:strand:- start:308 stop:463 length:156 start_codon:yes stop_codon:yes gene_type:complete